jgi:leader peptidase (prepilin peptidase)/N-methyltransferase
MAPGAHMNIFPYFYAAFGLIIGSFLNVCIYRLPRRESIVFPGSHCPNCGKAVRAYDNIPVLSYLLLLGKCRFCRQPISLQYPIVELLTGLAFAACFSQWGLTPPAFVNSLFLCAIIVLVFTDYHHQILPNVLTLPGVIAGILLSPLQSVDYYRDTLSYSLAGLLSSTGEEILLPWAGSMLGALIGGGILYLVATVYKVVRRRQGLGMGDVKMMAMVGAFMGWRLALVTIFLGSFLGSIVGICLVLFGGRTLQTKLAFGTFLGRAAVLALFYGIELLQWYAPAQMSLLRIF